jgi:isoleucyl-tRNA synthetase
MVNESWVKKLTNKNSFWNSTELDDDWFRTIMQKFLKTPKPFLRWKSSVESKDLYKAYSQTLALPKTPFEMRSKSSVSEPAFQQICCDYLYKQQFDSKRDKKFVLHDGPPYANGHLHLGHAVNKVLKDIVCRFKVLDGFQVHYVPGFDCHGLPIESKFSGTIKNDVELRTASEKYAASFIEIQKSEFKRWGIMGDWENCYITMSPKYESKQLEVFAKMLKDGIIYRGYRPVYWSPSNQTALAEAELEYPENHTSKSIYLAFPMRSKSGHKELSLENLHALIWTTTPWTIVANSGVCFNKALTYNIVAIGDKNLVVAADLVTAISSKIPLEIKHTFSGSILENYTCSHPLYDRASPLIHGDHVTNAQGTGLVHTAPGHGMEDFIVGKVHNLPVLCPVDDFGNFTNDVPEFKGQFVLKQGNESVISALEQTGRLILVENYNHKYPYDWRSKQPIIIRTTQQWFARLDELKEKAMHALQDVKFYPEAGRSRLESMVSKRTEWCISRQRRWGLPIPIFENARTGEILATPESIAHVASLVKQHGSNCWWSLPTSELLAPQYRNDGNEWIRGKDTLDVWFDSGSSWYSALNNVDLPVDLYLEGSDQHRGWFQSSLLTSVAMNDKAPYKSLVTHGFLLDENGRKMSKSLGNVIDPSFFIEGGKDKIKDPAYGADVMRLWIVSSDYSKDILVGRNVMAIQFEFFKKIRNTARFMLGNLNGFQKDSMVDYTEMRKIDQFILSKVSRISQDIKKCYEQYDFAMVYQKIRDLVFVDFSAFYFDILKDRLYSEAPNSVLKRSAQTTLYYLLDIFTKLFAPILPHTAEDVYQNYPFKTSERSIFMTGWCPLDPRWISPDLEVSINKVIELRDSINKLIEHVREDKLCASSLEVRVEIITQQDFGLSKEELEEIFMVSNVDVLKSGSSQGTYTKQFDKDLIINVFQAERKKCVRCWKFTSEKEHTLCARCESVLSKK